jgi:hypothetical protein
MHIYFFCRYHDGGLLFCTVKKVTKKLSGFNKTAKNFLVIAALVKLLTADVDLPASDRARMQPRRSTILGSSDSNSAAFPRTVFFTLFFEMPDLCPSGRRPLLLQRE